MNVILIIADTFRRDNLGCYGGTYVRTPHLDQFAREAYVFENAYLTSFPTVPNRHDIMTGRNTSTYAGWQPLPAEALTIQQILGSVGVTTMLIADTPWLFADGFNYCRDFEAYEWVRGQESDHYRSFPRAVTLPCHPNKLRWPDYTLVHYLRNVYRRYYETDYFAPQTIIQAVRWLEENASQGPFFLWVDIFDPHEPWDPPRHYVDLYDKDYHGEEVIYPRYGFWEEFLTPEELRHCRALYAAEATMVDHWVGWLLDRVDALGLRNNTAVIFTSDHGFLFGEHGLIGKAINPGQRDSHARYEAVPMYQEIIRIPLLIRMPGHHGEKRIHALVQSHDLMPTILELCGVITTEVVRGHAKVQVLQCGMFRDREWRFDPKMVHGFSLVPLMTGHQERVRDFIVSSNPLIIPSPLLAKCAIVTEQGWCLLYSGDDTALSGETVTGVSTFGDLIHATVGYAPALYYLPHDPAQQTNLIAEKATIAIDIHTRYIAYLEALGTEERYIQPRRKLLSSL